MLITKDSAVAADAGDRGQAPFSGTKTEPVPWLTGSPVATKRISIFGLGYVGAVSLACLARDGHRVIGVDIDPVKLDLIRNRKSPILEEGIQELMRDVVEFRPRVGDGRCQPRRCATRNSRSSAWARLRRPTAARISPPFCGSPNKSVRRCALKDEFHTIVIRSTVQPGTVEDKIEPILERASGKKAGVDFGVCFQPEFLREGSSIRDYDHPPYTIVGGNCEAAVDAVREAVPAPGHAIPRDQHSRRRNAQDGLQRLPRAEDHLRQRNRPRLAVDGHRLRTKSCAWSAPTSA